MNAVARMAGQACLAGALLLATVGGVEGQEDRYHLDIRGGLAFPADELKDLYDTGATFGLGVHYRLDDRWTFRVDGDIELYARNNLASPTDRDVPQSPELRLWHYNAGLEYRLYSDADDRWSVHVNAGAGATTVDTEEFSTGSSSGTSFAGQVDQTYFSLNGGLHIDIPVSDNVSIGLGGQAYFTAFDEEDSAPLAALSNEVEPFDVMWTFPISASLRWKLPY